MLYTLKCQVKLANEGQTDWNTESDSSMSFLKRYKCLETFHHYLFCKGQKDLITVRSAFWIHQAWKTTYKLDHLMDNLKRDKYSLMNSTWGDSKYMKKRVCFFYVSVRWKSRRLESSCFPKNHSISCMNTWNYLASSRKFMCDFLSYIS